jgi:hypothetical protein
MGTLTSDAPRRIQPGSGSGPGALAATARSPIDLQLHDLPPARLKPGDLVLLHRERFRVLDEPVTVHRGLGMFDEFKLMAGVYLQRPGEAKAAFHTWELDARLEVLRDRGDG